MVKLEDTKIFQHVSRFVGVPYINVSNWSHWEATKVEGEQSFSFETLDPKFWYWFGDTFWYLPLLTLGGYFTGYFYLQRVMKNRTPVTGHKFDVILAIYNLFMFLYHLAILTRYGSYINRVVGNPNWMHDGFCNRGVITRRDMFWMMMAGWGKCLMLLDTVFLVLRKKNVPIFHLYHHSLVVLLPMKVFPYGEPAMIWFGGLNMVQLVISYGVLFLRSLKLPFPGSSMFLLFVELLQMSTGLYCGMYTLSVIRSGGSCVRHPVSLAYFNFAYITMGLLVLKMIFENLSSKSVKTKTQ